MIIAIEFEPEDSKQREEFQKKILEIGDQMEMVVRLGPIKIMGHDVQLSR